MMSSKATAAISPRRRCSERNPTAFAAVLKSKLTTVPIRPGRPSALFFGEVEEK
jgi:hypothetical protein